MLGKKWKPRYFSPSNALASPTKERAKLSIQIPLSESAVTAGSPASGDSPSMEGIEQQISTSEEVNLAKANKKKKKAKNSQQLSTKSEFCKLSIILALNDIVCSSG